jgi:sulfopyruvate decarboxylase TPP-binding subunit
MVARGGRSVAVNKKRLLGEKIIGELIKCGITHIVWLPCYQLSFIYEAMVRQNKIALVPVCREGEGVAVAAGLALGGKKPVLLYQNTGLYESGDSVRLVSFELHLPLLMMLGYRGWQGTDSAGVIFEPTLDAWDIKYHILRKEEDVARISVGYKEAQETNKPVAILVVGEET